MTISNSPKERKLVPPYVESLEPYKPGKPPDELKKELGIEKFINLASNENSLGTPDSVIQAVQQGARELSRYPEAGGLTLRKALSERYRVKLENTTIGSGSESILANTLRAFLHEDDEVLTSEGTFIGLYVLVNGMGIKLRKVPLKNYTFDLEGIAAAINDHTKIIYLCNPNNPTGTIFGRAEFERFMEKVPEHVLVVLDEAYYEFACKEPDYPDSMTYRLDNVLTLRTFSKAWGMAGLRLGYGLGHDRLIDFINRIKLPFEPNILAHYAGLAALQDREFLMKTVSNNEAGMEYLRTELDALGLKRVPSHANFILIEMGSADEVTRVWNGLLKHGIAIRPLVSFGLPTCLRITIGTPEECELLIAALKAIL
ncbi:MAG: histidinol-phosphate transaminase [Candidatus Melainabacteria bacterium]|nr:histidinol-phosphate transaminase [Candidatus Melainabacteria bacterium]